MLDPINFNAMPSGVMTGTAVLTGKPHKIRGRKAASFQMKWTGTPAGTFKFQISNSLNAIHPDGTANADAVWTDLVSPAAFVAQQPAGAWSAAVGFFAFADLAVEAIRPVYTNASSTGDMTQAQLVAN